MFLLVYNIFKYIRRGIMKRVLLIILAAFILVSCSSKETVNLESMTVKEIVDYTADIKNFEVDSIKETADNRYRVILKTEILSSGTARKEFLMDTQDLLINLKDKADIQFINIEWQVEFKDSYGNLEYKPALRLDFSRETLDKINWDNMDYNNLDDIADDTWSHPGLE
jgi:hypothetical protein